MNRASFHARREEVQRPRGGAAGGRRDEDRSSYRGALALDSAGSRRCRASSAPRAAVVRAAEAIVRAVRARGRRGARAPHASGSTACGSRPAAARPARARSGPSPSAADPARRRSAAGAWRGDRGLPPAAARAGLPACGSPTARCSRRCVRPLASAGLYVPGGAGAYPSSVLMNAIPARVAGVPRLVLVTPPRTLEQNPAVAAAIARGRRRGARLPRGRRAGDRGARVRDAARSRRWTRSSGPATPGSRRPSGSCAARSRSTARRGRARSRSWPTPPPTPGFVAADLLAQAEHGSGDETVVLVTPSRELAAEVARLVAEGVGSVANRASARRALARHAAVVLVRDLDEGVAAVNAPGAGARRGDDARRGAGGARDRGRAPCSSAPSSPVAVGDYGIGPNHVLPTGGAARFASPLSVRDFQRRQSVVTLTRDGPRARGRGRRAGGDGRGLPRPRPERPHAVRGGVMDPLRHVKPAVRAARRVHARRCARPRSRSTRTRTPGTCRRR